MRESCDITVIGGGPGGTCTATILADAGFDVVLLERAHFPREHVGESLLPASLPILERLGVMPAIEDAGFVTKRGATMVWGTDPDPWSWYFEDSPRVAHPTSFQVVRSQFDAILLDNARKHGVEVHEGVAGTDIDFEGARATAVQYSTEDGTGTLAARFIVDASGQTALLSRKLDLLQWDTFFQNLAVYGYYRDAERLPAPDEGNIFIEAFEHGWLWLIPLHTGVVSVGAVVDKTTGQSGLRDASPRDFLGAQIEQAPHFATMLREASLVDEPQVVRDWSYTSSTIAGDGYVLVGDAACFIDPLFSSGVHLALNSGRLAAAYVHSSLNDPTMREAAGAAYKRLYDRQYDYFHLMAQLFYSTNRTADSYFWEARRQVVGDEQGLTPREAFVQAVSGHPPQGYERVVLEHGDAPEGIADEVQQVDTLLDERRREMEALSRLADGTNGLLRLVPELAATLSLGREPILAGDAFQWSHVLSGSGLPDGLPISADSATFVAKIDGRSSLAEIIAALQAEHPPQAASLIERDVLAALPELYVGGVVGVTIRGAGRNDACPCGSGVKYKRCHDGSANRDRRIVDRMARD